MLVGWRLPNVLTLDLLNKRALNLQSACHGPAVERVLATLACCLGPAEGVFWLRLPAACLLPALLHACYPGACLGAQGYAKPGRVL